MRKKNKVNEQDHAVRVISSDPTPGERPGRIALLPLVTTLAIVMLVAVVARPTPSSPPATTLPRQLAEDDLESDSATRARQNAETLLRDYLAALDRGDARGLATTLQPGGVVMVPSLGEAVHDWQDQASGDLDMDAIMATLAFLDSADTGIEVSGCSARTADWAEDRVTVACEISVRSILLEQHGIGPDTGGVTALIANGSIESVHLDRGPSIDLWQSLEPLPAVDDWLQRTFDPTAAAKHLPSRSEPSDPFDEPPLGKPDPASRSFQ